MKRLAVGLIACAALLLGVVLASAQVRITGAISGTVTDSSDSAVPGATVELKDEGTNVKVHVTITNVLNHPIWTTPNWNTTMGVANPNITSQTFGQIGGPLTIGGFGSRQMYLRGEITF